MNDNPQIASRSIVAIIDESRLSVDWLRLYNH
jgi:hypothetical protein